MTFRLYIADLAAYNEGELKGEWIDLPMDTEDLNEVLARHSNNFKTDWAIHDYDNDLGLRIEEYADIHDLNELAASLESLSSEELRIFAAAIDELGDDEYTIAEVLAVLHNSDYSLHTDVLTMTDLGYYVVDEYVGLNAYQEMFLSGTIDYEEVGRSYFYNGTFTSLFVEGLGWVEFHTAI